jgi:peptidoglycan hydrolase-like protein with peptidoglycan-binding domain
MAIDIPGAARHGAHDAHDAARFVRRPLAPAAPTGEIEHFGALVGRTDRPVGRLDLGSRERLTIGLQRAAGNRATAAFARRSVQREDPPSEWDIGPNPYAVETPGGGAARPGLLANPYAEENDPVTLSNARFTDQPALERIARGEAVLSAAQNGPAMKAVQQALIDLGFEQVQHEKDGRFGAETKVAIGLFRSRRGIPGEALSARALGELDQAAPPAGKAEEHFFDYERLFADGYLDITIAVGLDEGSMQSHVGQLAEAHLWLAARSFEAVPANPGQPEQYRLRRHVNYPTRAGNRIDREIIVRVGLIGPGAGAAAQYGKGLAESEIAVYTGHARRGIGPDFDKDKSAKENFIIGVGSALHAAGRAVSPSKIEQSHYVIEKGNDLEKMVEAGAFDPEKYRIWLFEACTTIAYFDELRGGLLPANMDRRNLDLVGTRAPAPLATEMAAALSMLDGILAAGTIEQITIAMDRAGESAAKLIPESEITAADRAELIKMNQNLNVHEGAGDNPVASTASP